MDEYGKLIVGCVIFIPVIAPLLVASWKLWHGKWLSFSDFTYIPGECFEDLQRRKGRRVALFCLVGAIACAGVLCIAAFSAVSGFPANLELASGMTVLLACAGGFWLFALSRRDAKAVENAPAGGGAEAGGSYILDKRRGAVLALVILAVLAIEIASSLVAYG